MANKEKYIRDKRSPNPLSENISKLMSANKAKNTKPELSLRKMLWKSGFKGYRIHPKDIPGRPDICFISKKVAIFVNGCFWHRCPYCNYDLPKHNSFFWQNKFENNVDRDNKKTAQLKDMDWKVVTIWECELKKDNLQSTLTVLVEKITS
jgi:DNA mismatch endonuclease (patch repair protein)